MIRVLPERVVCHFNPASTGSGRDRHRAGNQFARVDRADQSVVLAAMTSVLDTRPSSAIGYRRGARLGESDRALLSGSDPVRGAGRRLMVAEAAIVVVSVVRPTR